MKKNILIYIVLCVFLISCAEEKKIVYDYLSEDTTIGLTVEPINSTLLFSSDDKVSEKAFKLTFSNEFLTILDVDTESASYGNSFKNEPEFCIEECKKSVAEKGYCEFKIRLTDKAKVGDTGSIRLMFYYNHDKEGSFIKYHKLNFEYKNNTSQKK